MTAPIAVALDAPDVDTAARWAHAVARHVSVLKVGLELFCKHGPQVIDVVRGGTKLDLFLDLKLHDIPNTVAGAARAVTRLKPTYLTVHAAGGADMVRAAVEAAPDAKIAAVTLLTSIDETILRTLGVTNSPRDVVLRLASVAVEAGARAIVCSAVEVADVRRVVGPDITLITPGIRPAGKDAQDQARVATPEGALGSGADLLVIGRPITGAADPGAAAAAISAEIDRWRAAATAGATQ